MKEIELEILRSSYFEHFKKAKDLALIYPIGDKRRIETEKCINELTQKIQAISDHPH